MSSYTEIRLPKLKLTSKKEPPDQLLKKQRMNGMSRESPYNLISLINRLPNLQRKSAKSVKSATHLTPELDFSNTPPKTPQKPKTPKTTSNDYYDRIYSTLRTGDNRNKAPRTPRRVEQRKQDINLKSKQKDKKKGKEDKKGKSIKYGKPVPKTHVDTYLRPKTQAEKSISKYVKLPPIQRAYTFATLRKHKAAANDFLAALKANYPQNRYAGYAKPLSRSRSVLSVSDHIGRHNFARLSRSKSVTDISRGRNKYKNSSLLWTPRTARSKSVDPDAGSRSRPRSRARSRGGRSRSNSVARRLDKVVNKRSRSISVSRNFSRKKFNRTPLEIKQTRTSLARSKSLISIVSKRPPPSRSSSQQPTPRSGAGYKLRKTPSLPELRRSMSRLSLTSAHNEPSKKKVSPLFVAIKPDNQNSEKERFLKSPNYDYSPQFRYLNPPSEGQLSRFSRASDKFLDLSIKIMRNALNKFGTYEKYMEATGGRKISRYEITQAARRYLQSEGMDNEVDIHLSEDLLSRARMCVMGGRPTVIIRAVNMRENWVEGMLRHEIGTHYIRAWNNKQQLWGKSKKRNELCLEPANPTEEGIASLHSVLFRKDPCLWRGALLYYTIYKASQMSFADLFKDLGQFVKDTEVRWEYCIRAKRGYADTSQPGAFCKDQVYLNGALQILKNRNSIDFHMLVKCGKVSWRDLPKLGRLEPDLTQTRIPKFMQDIDVYKAELSRILSTNGLTQEDLEFV